MCARVRAVPAAMLREAGLHAVALTAPDGAPFAVGMPRAWFTARRPGHH
jgi:hypothetical protein